jgi:hypothetical protein
VFGVQAAAAPTTATAATYANVFLTWSPKAEVWAVRFVPSAPNSDCALENAGRRGERRSCRHADPGVCLHPLGPSRSGAGRGGPEPFPGAPQGC